MIAEALRNVFSRGHVMGTDGDEVLLGGMRTAAGERVTAETALKIAAVYTCVSVISWGVRSMPLRVVRDVGDGILRPDRSHRLWPILHDQANPEMSAGEVWERLAWDAMLAGNAYAFLERDSLGRVHRIWPLSNGRVQVGRDPRTRQKVFAVLAADDRERIQFVGTTLDILHVKGDPGPDPLLGVSVINRLRETLGRALAEDRHAATMMKNQGRPSGVITVSGRLTDERAERLIKRWNAAHGGASKAGRTAVLEDGADWKPVMLSAADLELVKQRAISREDIAIAFKVPGDMVLAGNSANLHYSSDMTRDVRLVKFAISPWAQRIQDALAINEALPWGTDHYPRFNPDGLLRADIKSRYEAYRLGLDGGWMAPNEARQREDLEPIQGLDKPKPLLDPSPAQTRRKT